MSTEETRDPKTLDTDVTASETPPEDTQEGASETAKPVGDLHLVEALAMADELVKTRIEKIHEAGEKMVSETVESMESLMNSVLDTAEAANQSAATANLSTQNLVKSARKLDDASFRSQKISTIVMSVGGALLLVSVAIFAFMSAQLSSKTSEVESMVLAVGKRVIEMNVSLGEFRQINQSIESLRVTQETFRDAQIALADRMSNLAESVQMMQTELPAAAAESVGMQSEVFTNRVDQVEEQIREQQQSLAALSKSLEGVGQQVGSLRGQLRNVSELNKDVSALVTLQRERYLELLQTQAQASVVPPVPEVLIQYPNPEAPLPKPAGVN